jgi:hypothetical protein
MTVKNYKQNTTCYVNTTAKHYTTPSLSVYYKIINILNAEQVEACMQLM